MILNNMTQPLTYLEIIVMSQFYRINSMWDISTGYYINFIGHQRIHEVVKFVVSEYCGKNNLVLNSPQLYIWATAAFALFRL